MILPLCTTQGWFPTALHLLAAPPVLLPRLPLVLPQNPTLTHPRAQRWYYQGIIQKYKNRGLSSEAVSFLLYCWRESTTIQYGSHTRKWLSFCLCRKIYLFQPSLTDFLDFLFSEFEKETGRTYSCINTMQSAISAVATINGQLSGHPLVARFMKAVFQERPSLPRYCTTWDSQSILDYIIGLGPNEDWSLIQ